MAAYNLEEQERIDALKDWWDKWSVWVYAGIAVFAVAMIGTQGWRYYQARQALGAEALYKGVDKIAQDAATSKDSKKLSETATAIADKFPSSFQASDAQLMAAKAAFEAGDLAAARTHLQWVVDNGRETYRSLARIRLAGVYLDEKKYDEALKLLDQVKDEGYAGMAADLRGDVFAAQGKRDEARAAYQLAVEKAGDRSPLKMISQAKLDAVGGSAAKPAETKADTKDGKGTKQ